MNEQTLIDIVNKALIITLEVSAPILIFGLVVGLLVSIFQAVTSIQEQTLAFVPKIVAIFLSLLIFGNWIMTTLTEFTISIITNIGKYIS